MQSPMPRKEHEVAALWRYLDDIEALHLGSAPTHVAQYHGYFDQEAFSRASELLHARHPVLTGRVRSDARGRHLLYVPDRHRPGVVFRGGDGTALRRELATAWDPRRELARIIHVRGRGTGYVAFRADHAIADGHSLRAMFDELWLLYDQVMRGVDPADAVDAALPLPPSVVLAARGEHRYGARRPDGSGAARTGGVPHRVPPVQEYIRLTEYDTRTVLEFSRRHGMSVHALLCGAVLMAHGRSTVGPLEPAAMVCVSPVNLRTRLSPPVGATETTNLVRVHRAEVVVSEDADAVALGRCVKHQLDAAIAHRELCSPLDLEDIAAIPVRTAVERRLATLQVSNNGIAHRTLENLAGLTVTDLFTPVDVVPGWFPMYSLLTFRGRLTVRCVYPSNLFGPEETARLRDRIATELGAVIGRPLAGVRREGEAARG